MSEVKFPSLNRNWNSPSMQPHSQQPVNDLTKRAWKASPGKPGTAIYWLVDQEGSYEQIFLPEVLYARSEDFAQALSTMEGWTLDAFRWVPNHVEAVSALMQAQCGGPCSSDLDCVNNSCRCIDGYCRRK